MLLLYCLLFIIFDRKIKGEGRKKNLEKKRTLQILKILQIKFI